MHNGVVVGRGYSGAPGYVNDPARENVHDHGVIPAGHYRIGTAATYTNMSDCVRLFPVGHNAYGRTRLWMHGNDRHGGRASSTGCVVMDLIYRRAVINSGDTDLMVVP